MRKLCSLILAAVAAVGVAQVSRSGLDTVAVTNARIVLGTGSELAKGTVVMRGGLILAVGENVTIPVGAEVFDAGGAVVYPGFIDMGTSKGLADAPPYLAPTIAVDESSGVPTAFHSSWAVARPDVRASSLLKPMDDAWKGYRSAGFTTALVFPPTGVIKGSATLANLRPAGIADVVLSPLAGMAVRLEGSGDSYPDSLLGAFAVFRQILMDAAWSQERAKAFINGGAQRGPSNPMHEALMPVLNREMPVIILADQESQIQRALALTNALNLRAIVLGAQRGWKAGESLKQAEGTIVSLNFGPEIPEVKPDDKSDGFLEPADRRAMRRQEYVDRLKNAGELVKGGNPIAFTSQGLSGPGELLKNLRVAIENGLSVDAAVAGLTRNPAKMMGLEKQLGTIEVGKIANLTILSHPLENKDAKAKMIYIDGRKIDPSRVDIPRPRFGFGEDHE